MSIGRLSSSLNKKYGGQVVTKGDQVPQVPRIPFGSLSLEVETGGGVPIGRITTITGEYSDGKTTVALKLVSEYQKKFPEKDVVWMDAEGAFVPDWANTLGVDVPSLYVVRPEYSQQAYDIAEQCIASDVGLLVIDSLAALTPKEEAEATMEEWQVGLAARINNKFVRRTHSSLNELQNNPEVGLPSTVVIINQLREQVGEYKPQVQPGGKGIGFAASLRILLRKGELYPKPKSQFDPTVIPKGQQIKFYVEKNKVGVPFTRGHVWFFFNTLDEYRTKGAYDRIEEVIRYARKYNIILQRGKYYDIVDAETAEVQTFEGSNALADHIRTNETDRLKIEQLVTERINESYVTEKQEVLERPRDQAEGKASSKDSQRQSSTEQRSHTVREAGRENGRVSDSAQGSKVWHKDTHS